MQTTETRELETLLTNIRLPLKTHARIIEAGVESSILFDCATGTWYQKDIKYLQSWMNRCYRISGPTAEVLYSD